MVLKPYVPYFLYIDSDSVGHTSVSSIYHSETIYLHYIIYRLRWLSLWVIFLICRPFSFDNSNTLLEFWCSRDKLIFVTDSRRLELESSWTLVTRSVSNKTKQIRLDLNFGIFIAGNLNRE